MFIQLPFVVPQLIKSFLLPNALPSRSGDSHIYKSSNSVVLKKSLLNVIEYLVSIASMILITFNDGLNSSYCNPEPVPAQAMFLNITSPLLSTISPDVSANIIPF